MKTIPMNSVAKPRSVSFSRTPISFAVKLAIIATSALVGTVNADPALPVELGGNSRFNIESITNNGNSLTVTQNGQVAWVKWDTYNVGAGNTVAYQYTEGGNAFHALNFVLGTQISEIQGNISSDGNVYIFNSNGIVFNNNAVINVAGFLASTQTPSISAINDIEAQLQGGANSLELDVMLSGAAGEGNIHINDNAALNSSLNDITLIGKTISAADTNLDATADTSNITSQGSINLYANNRSTVTLDLASDLFSVEVTEKLSSDPGTSLIDLQTSAMVAQVGVNISALSAQALTFNAVNSTGIVHADSINIEADGSVVLGDITAQSSLQAVLSAGDITDEGTVVAENATFVLADTTESNLVLDDTANNIGVLSASGDNLNNVTITDTFGIVLDGIDANTLTLTTSGDVTQTDVLTVEDAVIIAEQGDTRFNVYLDLVTQDGRYNQIDYFGAIGHNVYLLDSDGINLHGISATDDFILSTDGDIFQSGSIEVFNNSFIYALSEDFVAYDIVLEHDANEFGVLSALANNLSVVEGQGIQFGDVEVASSLTATALSGDIIGEGVMLAPIARFNALDNTRADIIFSALDNDIGVFSATGEHINEIFLNDTFGTILDGVTAELFTLNTTGAVTQTDMLNLNDALINAVNGDVTYDITLDLILDNGTRFNQIGALGGVGNTIQVIESDGIVLNGLTATGDFWLSTNGDVTQTQGLTVYGETLIAALNDAGVGYNIVLENSTNDLGLFSGIGANISLVNGYGIALGNVEVSETLTAVALTGDITDEGYIAGPDIALDSLNGDVHIDSMDNNIGILSAGGNTINITAVDGLMLGNVIAETALNATVLSGDVSSVGWIDAASANFTMLDSVESNITLAHGDNNIGVLSASGDNLNNVTITDTFGIVLDGIAANTLTLTTSGDVTQTDVLTVEDAVIIAEQGDTRFNVYLDLVTQDGRYNQIDYFGGVAENLYVQDVNGITLNDLVASSDVWLSTSGNIEQSGSLTVGGSASILAVNSEGQVFDINLYEQHNDFNQFVATGGVINVADSNGLSLGDVIASDSVTLNITGNIDQLGQTSIEAPELNIQLSDGARVNLASANRVDSVHILSEGSMLLHELNLAGFSGNVGSVFVESGGDISVGEINAQFHDLSVVTPYNVSVSDVMPNSVHVNNLRILAGETIELQSIFAHSNVELIAFGNASEESFAGRPVTILIHDPIAVDGRIGFAVANMSVANIPTVNKTLESYSLSGGYTSQSKLGLIDGGEPTGGVSRNPSLTVETYQAGLESFSSGQRTALPSETEDKNLDNNVRFDVAPDAVNHTGE